MILRRPDDPKTKWHSSESLQKQTLPIAKKGGKSLDLPEQDDDSTPTQSSNDLFGGNSLDATDICPIADHLCFSTKVHTCGVVLACHIPVTDPESWLLLIGQPSQCWAIDDVPVSDSSLGQSV
jgi:hypothetical protein